MSEKTRVNTIIQRLEKEYPHSHIALKYSSPLELLIATILSAQSTDVMVNKITPQLFQRYKNVEEYANSEIKELEEQIRSSGFFHQKARSIQAAARKIQTEYGGKVPDTMDELVKLPGVARKTANVVLYNAFGKTEGIAVDTHVRRLSRLLGLSSHNDPDKIEKDLMQLVPKHEWGRFTYLLIEHGRNICIARRPKCGQCVLKDICPSAFAAQP